MKASPLWALGGVLVLLVAAGIGVDRYASRNAPPLDESISLPALLSTAIPDAAGRKQSFGQWQGKVLVVNFWATWCAPCIEEMPILERIHQQYAAKGVEVVGISADSADKVKIFASQHSITYSLLVDPEGAIDFSRRLGNRPGLLPYTVVFAPDGTRLLSQIGTVVPGQLEMILQRNVPK